MEKRCGLASEARQACAKGSYDEALSALAGLKSSVRDSEDVAWVKANEAEVQALAASSRGAAAARAGPARPEFFPRIAGVKWRVDVSISTSSLERVMKPSVMMEWTLSTGDVKTFEMNVEQFTKLRYDTARLLRTMQEIERHPIMRIVD